MSGIVFAAIAPHGTMAIPEAVSPERALVARATQEAMLDLGRRFDAARPDSVVVFTPHNVHVEGMMAVVEAGSLAGDLSMWGAPHVALESPVDRELAGAVKSAIRSAGIPVAGISFGANDPDRARHPMDWAALVPLWFFGGRSDPQVPAVVVSPARDLGPDEHVRAGAAVADAAAASGRRVAVIASADHGHGHLADGPYGFRPESQVFDDRVVDAVRTRNLHALRDLDRELVRSAAADSWWQMLMLLGAVGDRWQPELLSYEHPTYFGMLCAAFSPLPAQ